MNTQKKPFIESTRYRYDRFPDRSGPCSAAIGFSPGGPCSDRGPESEHPWFRRDIYNKRRSGYHSPLRDKRYRASEDR